MDRKQTWLQMALSLVLVTVMASVIEAATLRVYTYPREWEVQRVDAAIEHFKQKYPNVAVDVHAGWANVLDTIVAGGLTPDIIIMDYGSIPNLVGKNMLMPIDTFLQKDKEVRIDRFLPGVLDFVSWMNRPVGLPINMSAMGLLYNMDLFDQAGVAYPDEQWTWDHYVQIGKKLTRDTNGNGNPEQFGIDLRWNDQSFWPAFVYQSGGRFWNKDYTQSLIASPEVERALQFLTDMVAVHHVNPRFQSGDLLEADLSGIPVGRLFREQRAAMTWGGNNLIREPQIMDEFRIGMSRMPRGPVSRDTLTNGDFVAMYRHTEQPNLAWEFMKSISITSEKRHLTGSDPLVPVEAKILRAKFELPQYRKLPADVFYAVHLDGRQAEVIHPVTKALHDYLSWDVMDSKFFTGERIAIRPLLQDLQRTINAEISEALKKGASWSW